MLGLIMKNFSILDYQRYGRNMVKNSEEKTMDFKKLVSEKWNTVALKFRVTVLKSEVWNISLKNISSNIFVTDTRQSMTPLSQDSYHSRPSWQVLQA